MGKLDRSPDRSPTVMAQCSFGLSMHSYDPPFILALIAFPSINTRQEPANSVHP
jgi:hypothetical protein